MTVGLVKLSKTQTWRAPHGFAGINKTFVSQPGSMVRMVD
jgi:hypothetical protein